MESEEKGKSWLKMFLYDSKDYTTKHLLTYKYFFSQNCSGFVAVSNKPWYFQ